MWQLAGALTMTVVFSACSQSASESTPTAADCAVAIRFEGVVYVEGGFSQQAVEHLGRADRASCGDVGPDPRGNHFVDDTARVPVWSFPGYDPALVVGVRESGQTFRVLFAEDLPTSAKREIRQPGLLDVGKR